MGEEGLGRNEVRTVQTLTIYYRCYFSGNSEGSGHISFNTVKYVLGSCPLYSSVLEL